MSWKYDDVKDFIESKGFILITNEYKNNQTKLLFKDSDGYFYYCNFGNLLKSHKPSKFHISNPHTIQNIKLWCKLNNKPFELLSDIYNGANILLRWKCLKDNCGEEFESTWGNTHDGSNCPYCCNPPKKFGKNNCLATKNPDLALEWHPTKNGKLTPWDIASKSNKKVWWQCSKNPKHEWETTPNKRVDMGSGCPYCAGRYATDENNLLVVNPELCKEWDYERNKNKPEDYTPISGKTVWWKCKNNPKHMWKAKISNRSNGKCCPQCNESKGEKRISNYLISKCFSRLIDNINNTYKIFIPQKEFDGLLGLGGKNLSYDFYLPQYNLLIEFQGEQHEKFVKGIHKTIKDFEKQKEHDRRKCEYAQKHNIRLLEIWYYDYNRIEEILEKELNINK